MYFSGTGAGTPGGAVPCPADAEFDRPASAGSMRDAYRRAEACFRRQAASGRDWRTIR
jgi:hypothetical protein